jgi:hypothetical protein
LKRIKRSIQEVVVVLGYLSVTAFPCGLFSTFIADALSHEPLGSAASECWSVALAAGVIVVGVVFVGAMISDGLHRNDPTEQRGGWSMDSVEAKLREDRKQITLQLMELKKQIQRLDMADDAKELLKQYDALETDRRAVDTQLSRKLQGGWSMELLMLIVSICGALIFFLTVRIANAQIKSVFDQFPDDPDRVQSHRAPSTIFELFCWMFGANR